VRLALLLILFAPASVVGQFHATAFLGFADHAAHARDHADPEHPAFQPGVSRAFGVAIGFDRAAWRFALVARTEAPDLILGGVSSGLITPNALEAMHVGAEVGRRVAGSGSLPSLHILLGAGVTRWSFPDFEDQPRSRFTGSAALESGIPLGRHFDGVVRLEVAATGSLFDAEDLPEGYEARTGGRGALALGLRWRR
jgi:hypothetical protein